MQGIKRGAKRPVKWLPEQIKPKIIVVQTQGKGDRDKEKWTALGYILQLEPTVPVDGLDAYIKKG